MTTFALLHGAYHSGWHFHLLARELEARGHQVIAPDLPCQEATAGAERYANVAAAALEPVTDEIIAVGHSLGGLFLPLLPARNPRIARLVYLGALLPEPGMSLDEQMRRDPSIFSHYQAQTEGIGHPDGSASCPEARALEVFFEDCRPIWRGRPPRACAGSTGGCRRRSRRCRSGPPHQPPMSLAGTTVPSTRNGRAASSMSASGSRRSRSTGATRLFWRARPSSPRFSRL